MDASEEAGMAAPGWTVTAGQTCLDIRRAVEGAGLRYDHAAMVAANPGVDLGALEPGQVLHLPPEWATAVSSPGAIPAIHEALVLLLAPGDADSESLVEVWARLSEGEQQSILSNPALGEEVRRVLDLPGPPTSGAEVWAQWAWKEASRAGGGLMEGARALGEELFGAEESKGSQVQAQVEPEEISDDQGPLGPGYVQSRAAFTGPDLIEIAPTTEILDTVWRYFPEGASAWSGYLNDDQQLKKLNYHHAYMLWAIPRLQELADARDANGGAEAAARLTEEERAALDTMEGILQEVAPPEAPADLSGLDSVPADTSSAQDIATRHAVVSEQKRVLAAMMTRTHIHTGDVTLAYCWQTVAFPGNSKHGSGRALDIKGASLSKIKAAATDLGAKALNEAAHQHVVFESRPDTTELDTRLLAEATIAEEV